MVFRRYRKMFGYWFSPSSEELWDGGRQLLKVDFTTGGADWVFLLGYFCKNSHFYRVTDSNILLALQTDRVWIGFGVNGASWDFKNKLHG